MEIHSFWSAIGNIEGYSSVPFESDTVPDLSLSVKDILTRFRRGTVSLEELDRNLPDSDDDIEDSYLDGIEDLVDVKQLKDSIYEKVYGHLRSDRDDLDSSSHDTPGDSKEQVKEDS